MYPKTISGNKFLILLGWVTKARCLVSDNSSLFFNASHELPGERMSSVHQFLVMNNYMRRPTGPRHGGEKKFLSPLPLNAANINRPNISL